MRADPMPWEPRAEPGGRPATVRAPRPSPRACTWAVLGLAALVAASYGQTLGFELVWDDYSHIVTNRVLRGRVGWLEVFTSPQSAYLGPGPGVDRAYRPLLALSLAADRAIWGMRPAGYHLTNLLAHFVTVLLVWRLAWWMAGSAAAAFAAAALLALHPSAVEAVAFVSARMDVFVGLGIAAVLLLLRGCLGPGGNLRLVGALLCFLLALGLKETAVMIPAMVTWTAWAYPVWFGGQDFAPRPSALVARAGAFWAILALYGVLRQLVIPAGPAVPWDPGSILRQGLRGLVGIATYGQMTLLPRPVTGYVAVGPPAGLLDGRIALGLAVVGVLLGGLLWLRRANPAAACGLGWYAAALLPPSNLVPIYDPEAIHVAERSLYPALAGWCLFVAMGIHGLYVAGHRVRIRSRTLQKGAVALTLGAFLLVSAVKASAWRDEVTLWTRSVRSDPGALAPHINLSVALARSGDLERAQDAARQAERSFPASPDLRYLRGWLAELRDEPAEALRHYERSIALGLREGPAFRMAALLSARLQDWERAGRWLTAGAEHFPHAAWPQVGLGWWEGRRGRADLARASFERAAALEPRAPERPWFLGQLLAAEGRAEEAAQAYRQALALDPSFVPGHRELALLAESAGRAAEAVNHWRHIAALLPAGGPRAEALERIRRLEAAAPGPLR